MTRPTDPQSVGYTSNGNESSAEVALEMQLPGMMTGKVRLPRKLEQAKARERRSQHLDALAGALRKTTTEEPK